MPLFFHKTLTERRWRGKWNCLELLLSLFLVRLSQGESTHQGRGHSHLPNALWLPRTLALAASVNTLREKGSVSNAVGMRLGVGELIMKVVPGLFRDNKSSTVINIILFKNCVFLELCHLRIVELWQTWRQSISTHHLLPEKWKLKNQWGYLVWVIQLHFYICNFRVDTTVSWLAASTGT